MKQIESVKTRFSEDESVKEIQNYRELWKLRRESLERNMKILES